MNITILNGNPETKNPEFDGYLELYRVKMHNTGHYVRSFTLRDMKITDLRSTGSTDYLEFHDDFRYVNNSFEDTDLLVIASPLDQGSMSPGIRIFLDRLTKALQPSLYLPSVITGETTGIGKVPIMGMILKKEADTNEQDLLRTRLSGERIAANIHTVLDFCITTDTGVSDAVCKTFRSIDYNSFIERTYSDLITGSAYSG